MIAEKAPSRTRYTNVSVQLALFGPDQAHSSDPLMRSLSRPHLPLVVREVRLAILLMAGDTMRWIPDRAAPWWNECSVACRWRSASGMEAWECKGPHLRDTQRAAVVRLQLRRAHQQLRDELARIREALGGDEHVVTGLQVHCLAFCSALATRHRGEDDGMFTRLLDARPDLAPGDPGPDRRPRRDSRDPASDPGPGPSREGHSSGEPPGTATRARWPRRDRGAAF